MSPTTCFYCKNTKCAPRYMTLSYKYNEPITLKSFADEFSTVATSSEMKIHRYIVSSSKLLPLMKYVWLDVGGEPSGHGLRLKLTVSAPGPNRPVLPTVASHLSCEAALAEVLRAMEDMNEEGEFAVGREIGDGSPGVMKF
ncbi:hypothetical protein BJX64DRAFT_291793 [Aspergillus heterothallicus]